MNKPTTTPKGKSVGGAPSTCEECERWKRQATANLQTIEHMTQALDAAHLALETLVDAIMRSRRG